MNCGESDSLLGRAVPVQKYAALLTNATVLFQQYNYIHDFRGSVAAQLEARGTAQRSVSR